MDEIRKFDPFLEPRRDPDTEWNPARVMVVDDDPAAREALKACLEPGYEVFCLPCGDGVLAGLEKHRPGLLILELGAPGGRSAELCRAIRAHEGLSGLPILFLTAGPGAVGDYFIAKPFEPEALLERVELLLRSRPSPN